MARPKESVQAKGLLIAEAIAELLQQDPDPDRPIGGKRPTQVQVAQHVGRSVEWVRKYWPAGLRDPFVTTLTTGVFQARYAPGSDGLSGRPWVGTREDAAATSRTLKEAGVSVADIASVLGLEEEKAVQRLLRSTRS